MLKFSVAVTRPVSVAFTGSKSPIKFHRVLGEESRHKPDVPHEVFNMSDTELVVAFVARSSADEWDNIIPYDRNQPG